MTDMARILGIKRTHLSAIESGRLHLPRTAIDMVNWIAANRHRFVPADTTPATPIKLIQKDLKKLRIEKDNLNLALEKRQESEKNSCKPAFCARAY
jgi:transcriptional regulator with XRE-family HTH domain